MLKALPLRELIEQNIPLGRQLPSGWYVSRCPVCNDYKERAGFLFEGDDVVWHDFNCGAAFSFKQENPELSKNTKRILKSYGISDAQLDAVTANAFFNKPVETSKEIDLESLKKKINLSTPEIDFPPLTYPLGSDKATEIQKPLIEYLKSRHIDYIKLKCAFSLDSKWLNRIIIPVYRNEKLIFWQARSILPNEKIRYKSPSFNKDAVLWGYDNLFTRFDSPLFITEGIFDAYEFNGVAMLGSSLNEAKVQVLSKSPRKKVFVIDKNKNGLQVANKALELGWDITFVDSRVSDINESVRKFGRSFTAWSLMKNMSKPSVITTAENKSLTTQLALNMAMAISKLKGVK